jgi:hypothetical protein
MKGEAVKNQEKRRSASRKNKCLEQSTAANRRQSPTRQPNAGGDCGSATVRGNQKNKKLKK